MLNFGKLTKAGTATRERLMLLGALVLWVPGQSCLNGYIGTTEYRSDFFDPPAESLSTPVSGGPTCDRTDGVACEDA